MNTISHLTPGQLDALLIGDRNDAATRHLEACPSCAAEVAEMRTSLTLLSEAITSMAKAELFHHNTRTSLLTSTTKRPVFRLVATFALAASVAVVAAILPVGRLMHPPAAHPAITATANTVESDEALLTEIDQQLSASVPEALEPLQDPTGGQTKTVTPTTSKKD
ncbi:hypothetical protein SAMN05421771_1559 [Granulicella pectinivorans]|uniref:Zinc-finger n=1 Tax=Granulicella pectinivorans TaxID=474950 RepID=A0A1I6LZM9_9BACT|nr:hypothetical protein [Granulicella pectinivorans]SFS08921.1 hypothetical protein SAMN05421771_1559 [Granulicella pectinivorans]